MYSLNDIDLINYKRLYNLLDTAYFSEEHNCVIQTKYRVSKLQGNLDVVIYTLDHDPPHFHIISKTKKINAKFLISTGEAMKGNEISRDDEKIVLEWFKELPPGSLRKMWTESRPT